MFGRRWIPALVVPLMLVAAGCDDDDEILAPDQPDIVETAIAAGDFETLVTALEAADLVATLQGPGPFTVFAPTDAAFEALPAGTLESLLLPENRDQLTAILTYHVVSGEFLAADVVGRSTLPTVQGQALDVTVDGSTVRVDEATIVQTDILTGNGVIHVIDAVLLPE